MEKDITHHLLQFAQHVKGLQISVCMRNGEAKLSYARAAPTTKLGVAQSVNMDAANYPREFPRVASIDQIDPNDFVALKRAKDQRTRDR